MDLPKSSLIVFSAQIGYTIAGFLATIYFARVLGPGTLGSYYLFISVTGIMFIFIDAGLGGATIKRISESQKKDEFFTASIILRTLVFIPTVIVIFLFRDWFNDYIGADVWFFIIAFLILTQYQMLLYTTLSGEKKVGTSAVLNLASELSKVAIQVLLVVLGFGLFGLLGGICINLVFTLLIGIGFISVGLKKPTFEHVKSLFNFSKFTFAIGFGEFLYQWMDLMVIGYFLEKPFVGVYGACWMFSSAGAFASVAIGRTIFPQISEWSANKRTEDISNAFSEGITYSLILVFPVFFGLLILAKPVLYHVYSPPFEVGWLVLIILSGARLIEGGDFIIRHTLLGVDSPKSVFMITLVTIPLNLIANVFLVYYFGFVGAAIATLLTIVVSLIMGYKYVKNTVKVSIPWAAIGSELVSAVVMGIALFVLSHFVSIDSVSKLGFIAALGGALYLGLLFGINRNIRNRLLSLVGDILRIKIRNL